MMRKSKTKNPTSIPPRPSCKTITSIMTRNSQKGNDSVDLYASSLLFKIAMRTRYKKPTLIGINQDRFNYLYIGRVTVSSSAILFSQSKCKRCFLPPNEPSCGGIAPPCYSIDNSFIETTICGRKNSRIDDSSFGGDIKFNQY